MRHSIPVNVTVNLSGIVINDGNYKTLQLSALKGETFISHTQNALKKSTVSVASGSFIISVPKLSTTAVLLQSNPTTGILEYKKTVDKINIFPNPANNQLKIKINRSHGNDAPFYDN